MKFGQFIEYNMRNIFVEKSYPKCAGQAILTQTLIWNTKIEHISGSVL